VKRQHLEPEGFGTVIPVHFIHARGPTYLGSFRSPLNV
jgi:hypothetical protein